MSLDMEEPKTTVKLISEDKVEFPGIDVEILKCSSLLIQTLENTTDDAMDIPFSNVSGETLKLILEWARHHHAMQQVTPSQRETWMTKLLTMDKSKLFDLTRAANFLDIPPLLDECTTALAKMIEGKTAVQIRQMFDPSNN